MMIAGNKDVITIAKQCPFCGKEYTFEVPAEGYYEYIMGSLIQNAFPTLSQNAFPTLSPTEREYLVSGLCDTCQKEIFGEEEEDDEDSWEDEIYND